MANVFHILDIIPLITGKRQDMIIDIPAVVVSIQINIWTDRPIGSGMDSFVREILFEKGPVFEMCIRDSLTAVGLILTLGIFLYQRKKERGKIQKRDGANC